MVFKMAMLLLLANPMAASSMNDEKMDILKEEIRQVEASFAEALQRSGMAAAFLEFADEEAVLSRNGKLFKGKAEIKAYFDDMPYTDIQLEWEPEFIDVSASGDLAYTYGPYTFKALGTEGTPVEAAGIFHTVWKKQADGSWKYVWD